ncbi:unnamed protein product [Orchesella dallaii]|uniref:Uncharacterized protein n=1 Tax=Orchesella dallaii TaxID=48710 RepID=A0ABP1R0K9_9HEXA
MGILLLTFGLLVHVSMSNPSCNTVADCHLPPDDSDNCPAMYSKKLMCCFGQCDCCDWTGCCEQFGCAGQQGKCHNPYDGGCGEDVDC